MKPFRDDDRADRRAARAAPGAATGVRRRAGRAGGRRASRDGGGVRSSAASSQLAELTRAAAASCRHGACCSRPAPRRSSRSSSRPPSSRAASPGPAARARAITPRSDSAPEGRSDPASASASFGMPKRRAGRHRRTEQRSAASARASTGIELEAARLLVTTGAPRPFRSSFTAAHRDVEHSARDRPRRRARRRRATMPPKVFEAVHAANGIVLSSSTVERRSRARRGPSSTC